MGQRHKNYLLKNHKVRYYNLLTACKLVEYLADIDQQANGMFENIVKQFTEQEGINKQLKSENQIEWIRKVNSIRSRALEIVNNNLIYK